MPDKAEVTILHVDGNTYKVVHKLWPKSTIGHIPRIGTFVRMPDFLYTYPLWEVIIQPRMKSDVN